MKITQIIVSTWWRNIWIFIILPLETLVAKCELKMASWSSEKAEKSSPTFWLKIWRKFWFWRGKTGRVWCPEKWWFLLRLWFGILFCWRDEKFMLLPSQFWMACSTVIDIEYNKRLDRQRPCLEGDFNGGSNNIVQSNKSVWRRW